MTFDIFQVDWITVNTIIIVLLIPLLIGVKVLKEIYRWRFFFSKPLTIKRVDNLRDLNNHISSVYIKKCILTKSSFFQQEYLTKPTIIIIRKVRKLMLLKALTEAFCTFGYNVINIRLKILTKSRVGLMTSDIEKELHQILTDVAVFYKQNAHLVSQKYNIIDFSKEIVSFNLLLKDNNCKNIILINPCLLFTNILYLYLLFYDYLSTTGAFDDDFTKSIACKQSCLLM